MAFLIASFYRPLARHGIPDETVDIFDCLDIRPDSTHAIHITAMDPQTVVIFMTQ